MKLYHFTSQGHVGTIFKHGTLKVTDANLAAHDLTLSRVCWFVDEPELTAFHGLPPRKTEVRFTVSVPDDDVHRWLDWAPQQPGAEQEWIDIIVKAGGGPRAADHWFVVPRPVTVNEWREVRVLTITYVMSPLTGMLMKVPS